MPFRNHICSNFFFGFGQIASRKVLSEWLHFSCIYIFLFQTTFPVGFPDSETKKVFLVVLLKGVMVTNFMSRYCAKKVFLSFKLISVIVLALIIQLLKKKLTIPKLSRGKCRSIKKNLFGFVVCFES